MYMGGRIHQYEELAAGMLDADNKCAICRGKATTECDCCEAETCSECAVKCACCGSDNELCLACAIKNGYAGIDGKLYCEGCASEMESLLEEARR